MSVHDPKTLEELRDLLLPGLWGSFIDYDYIVTDKGLLLADVTPLEIMVTKEEFESGNWKEPYLSRFRELGK